MRFHEKIHPQWLMDYDCVPVLFMALRLIWEQLCQPDNLMNSVDCHDSLDHSDEWYCCS